MNDFQMTIMVLGNPLFALTFYSIGRQWMNKKNMLFIYRFSLEHGCIIRKIMK